MTGPIGVTRYSPRDIFGALMTDRFWPKAVIREQSLSAKIAQLQKASTATSSLKSPILQKLQSPIKIEQFHLYRDQSQALF